MQFESDRMYRVRDVAQTLDVSVATIYRAIEAGALNALKLGTGKGTLRIPGTAANSYVESCTGAAYQEYVAGDASMAGSSCVPPAAAGGRRDGA